MKIIRLCECGHSVKYHADFGMRQCAYRECPCECFLEDDNLPVVEWKEGPGMLDIMVTVALLGFSMVALAKCLSMGPDGEPRRPKPDPIAVDSAKAKGCPKGCTCAYDGSIVECPDLRPPMPMKKGGAK